VGKRATATNIFGFIANSLTASGFGQEIRLFEPVFATPVFFSKEPPMPSRFLLTGPTGAQDRREFALDLPGRYVVGRSNDCDIQLAMGHDMLSVSRHHCLLIFRPPNLAVRDLGSSNGTYVNGEKVGRRSSMDEPEMIDFDNGPEHELKTGDELRLGRLAFQVAVTQNEAATEVETLPLSFF
jgi:hypothetical protein